MKDLNKAVKSSYLEGITIDDDTIKYIANLAGSDLRYAYNLLEIAFYASNDQKVDINLIKQINSKPVFFSDKNGDGHYDVLSAFQKIN